MRLTPAQVGMSLLLGRSLPTMRIHSRTERIALGRQWLVRITREDFGYDARAWHDHLLETDAGGYKWSNQHRGFPTAIETAMADEVWQACVAEAESTDLCHKLINRDERQRDAVDRAEREWSGKSRVCPNCSTSFESAQDKGQCPNCGQVFYASHPESGNDSWWLRIE